jgi:glutamate/tyrosine decarboxylase-like PLP-dependent enzyme
MATPGQPTSYSSECCELAHNYCLLGAPNEVGEAGVAWLAGLDGLVRDLATEWQLSIGRILSGGTEALRQGGLAREDTARRWDKSTAIVRTHAKTAAKRLFC